MRTPTEGQWESNAEAVCRAAPRLAKNLPALADWAKDVERGYSAQSPGFTGAGKGGVSDPTARLATSGTDYVRKVADLARRVDKVFAELLVLDGLVGKLMPETPERGRKSTITRCVNCGEDCLPRARASRCPNCYEYWRLHHRDRVKDKAKRAECKAVTVTTRRRHR